MIELCCRPVFLKEMKRKEKGREREKERRLTQLSILLIEFL